jgi:2-isopropylmalate synthase
MKSIFIYDTTLRDGTQREGISLSVDDKIKIAQRLDAFGVHYIEGGWPGSNPKDAAFFEMIRGLDLCNAKITAFGSTAKKGTQPENDANIQALIAADTPVVTLVGKSWDMHVTQVIETSLENNLAMIRESVAYIKSKNKEVIFDGEHFFDGYKANPDYAIDTLKAAVLAGVDVVVLCDTNGGTFPWEVEKIVGTIVKELSVPIGIHAHDDGGCGTANTIMAVLAGAIHVQGTINGYGERVGNANLCTVIPDLQLKMGFSCVNKNQLPQLTELSRYVDEVANLPHNDHLPYVGESAFAHKGGIHMAAMLKNEDSYQHINPGLVGNQRRTVISELSGRGNIQSKSHQFGLDVDSDQALQVLEQIKDLES